MIKVQFEDDSTRTINFKPIVGYGMYRPLRDPKFFRKVYISETIPTLTWPNGADFNPDHLYSWEEYESIYLKRVREWENVPAQ